MSFFHFHNLISCESCMIPSFNRFTAFSCKYGKLLNTDTVCANINKASAVQSQRNEYA
jgi:hypothetical protein